MANINYTFIIPHKNIPTLLQRCLNSIPRREDIQIIVVDDNSDPDKVDFNHFPGAGEPCVEVYFTKEGKGAGYARNVGLGYAQGKWLLFADADDYYSENFIDILDVYKDKNIDILYFSAYSVNSETLLHSNRANSIIDLILKYEEDDINKDDLIRYTLWVPWNKMFNRSFIVNYKLFFEEILSGNDAMFVVRAGHLAKNISVENKKLYCVTYRNDSLTYHRNIKSVYSSFKMRLRLNDFFIAVGKRNMCVLLYGTVYDVFKHYSAFEAFKLIYFIIQGKQLFLFIHQIISKLHSLCLKKNCV